MPDTLAVVTPWYPSRNAPYAGGFVQSQVAAMAERFDRIEVYNTEDWVTPARRMHARLVRRAMAGLVGSPNPRIPTTPVRVREGWLTRVPALVTPRTPYAERAEGHERALLTALPTGRIEADVVHGHVGIFGGWLAVRLARPGARVIVTEHATFLNTILRHASARAVYDEVLDRCDAFLCVGEVLRDQVLTYFPHHADKLHVVPNAVAVEQIPMRSRPVRSLRRWLYAGRLIEQKGVRWLVEAFGVVALEDPEVELTLVGDGRLSEPLARRVEQLGIADRVHFVGPVPPDQMAGYYHENDLLVHCSRYETFGMTIVEALASGMPVLCTACGGPEETLGPIEDHAGQLVPVGDGVAEILHGYRRLSGRIDSLDPVKARAEMESRYSFAAVAGQLDAFYFGQEVKSRQ